MKEQTGTFEGYLYVDGRQPNEVPSANTARMSLRYAEKWNGYDDDDERGQAYETQQLAFGVSFAGKLAASETIARELLREMMSRGVTFLDRTVHDMPTAGHLLLNCSEGFTVMLERFGIPWPAELQHSEGDPEMVQVRITAGAVTGLFVTERTRLYDFFESCLAMIDDLRGGDWARTRRGKRRRR